jgi:hypothetical protein
MYVHYILCLILTNSHIKGRIQYNNSKKLKNKRRLFIELTPMAALILNQL